jgi:hypothetical protein
LRCSTECTYKIRASLEPAAGGAHGQMVEAALFLLLLWK